MEFVVKFKIHQKASRSRSSEAY